MTSRNQGLSSMQPPRVPSSFGKLWGPVGQSGPGGLGRPWGTTRPHCRISYIGGLGTSRCIMGLTTQDPYIQKEHTELYKILKFRVNCANIEQDTTIQKRKNLVTNVWFAGHLSGNPYILLTLVRKAIHFFANFEVFEWLYLVQYWPN